ncbi:unnamed protein product, partial [Rotaria sp. Silwood1]
DQRSLLSLIIYLNDNFEKGKTKFYFPKQSPKFHVKGLTIKQEIEVYNGLEHRYKSVKIKPKKGHAILFTHNLLHEVIAPEINKSSDIKEGIILRTDILVKRTEKPLGFAITPEERDNYQKCLNFFYEAQRKEFNMYSNKSNQSIELNDIEELYERALSIRSSYPCLLELKLKESVINEQNKLIEQLPTEIWLSIFKHIDKQDIQNLTFAFPDFQSLKTIWENEELKKFEKYLFREKFIPTIVNQYFDQPLFCFVDSNFFFQHIDQCCRIAAIYAFFLLGHEKDSRTYTIHYDRNTQARQPIIDFDHSVDRTYMTNRHQSQFIGQDLLSRFRFKTKTISDLNDIKSDSTMNVDNEEHEVYEQYYSQYEKEKIMTKILREIIDCDQLFDPDKIDNRVYHWRNCKYDYDDILAY